jgi:hypothetical protein
MTWLPLVKTFASLTNRLTRTGKKLLAFPAGEFGH